MDVLWLATQSPESFAVHLWTTHKGFATIDIIIVAGISELKSSFCALPSNCFGIH